jgi:kinesin family protein 18/19
MRTGLSPTSAAADDYSVEQSMDSCAVGPERDLDTDGYKSAMEQGQSNILVAVRVRPVLKKERLNNCREFVKVLDDKMLVIHDPHAEANADDPLRAGRRRDKKFAFDHVFGSHAQQRYVFEKTTLFLLDGVLNGYNATVFAYGATGSGKTHTMLGTVDQPGLMMLTLQELFRKIRATETDRRYKVTLTYLEVYNENLRDLLNPSSEYLDLREDPIKGSMKVAGLTEIEATCAEDVLDQLRIGNKYRTQEATAANEGSSRSHAVLQVVVEQRERTADVNAEIKIGKLSMIDLAGSERASITQNRGIRMVEGANINRSLLALGNCINALGDKSNKGSYVPYRDSKLTRLLKDSLGGNCRTVMVAAISPCNFEETLNTLKYAHRAKNIKTTVERNVLNVSYHVHQYMQIISELRTEVSELKQKLITSGSGEDNMSEETLRERKVIDQLRQQIAQNFEDRMQIRRSLMELEEQNVKNVMEINKIQVEVSQLDRELQSLNQAPPSPVPTATSPNISQFDADAGQSAKDRSKTPHRLAQSRREIRTIVANIEKNKRLKVELISRLKKLEEEAKASHSLLSSVVKTSDMRDLLEMNYRARLLELQNVEFEEAAVINGQMMQARAVELKQRGVQLKRKDAIISKLMDLLKSNNIEVPSEVSTLYVNDLQADSAESTANLPRLPERDLDSVGVSMIPYQHLLYPSSLALLQNIGLSSAAGRSNSPVMLSPPDSRKKRRSPLSTLSSHVDYADPDTSTMPSILSFSNPSSSTSPIPVTGSLSSLPPIRKSTVSTDDAISRPSVSFQQDPLSGPRLGQPAGRSRPLVSGLQGALGAPQVLQAAGKPSALAKANAKFSSNGRPLPVRAPLKKSHSQVAFLKDVNSSFFSQPSSCVPSDGLGSPNSSAASDPGHIASEPPVQVVRVPVRVRKTAFSENHDSSQYTPAPPLQGQPLSSLGPPSSVVNANRVSGAALRAGGPVHGRLYRGAPSVPTGASRKPAAANAPLRS